MNTRFFTGICKDGSKCVLNARRVCESVQMSSVCVWAGIKPGFRDTSNECVASVSDSVDKISETEVFF